MKLISSFNSLALSCFFQVEKLHLPRLIFDIHCLSLSLFLCFSVCARMLKLDLSCPCCSHHSLPSPKTVSFAQRRATPSLSGKHLFLFNKLCPTETRGSAHFALIGRAGSRHRCDEEEERERERERVLGGGRIDRAL